MKTQAGLGWTTAAEVRSRVAKEWDKGRLLKAAWVADTLEFPQRWALKGPSSDQWSDQFDQARAWISGLEGLPLEWREFTHPRLGRNRVPVAVVWPDLDSLVAFAGKRAEVVRTLADARAIVGQCPALSPWVDDHLPLVLELRSEWPRLLSFLDWMVHHPRPRVYLRQVDLPGVHTKFLEAHRGVLADLLDLVLPAEAFDATKTGVGRFAERYGFLTKPPLVRFRFLDPSHVGPRDQSWRLDDWARLESTPRRVFVTENEVNFLSFPDQSDALVVFGAGYGFDGWEGVAWLAHTELWYWGDLDTHGFAILDQFRARFPSVGSFLMDEATLLAHRALWGAEPDSVVRELPRLTEDERAVYTGLVQNRWGSTVRLEQERIGYWYVEAALSSLVR